MKVVIEPHRGIGPISLGMTRDEVAAVMAALGGGPPVQTFAETDCYFGSAVHVSFVDAGRADFVQVVSHWPGEAVFQARDVFDTPADDLLALVRSHEQPALELSRPPDHYIFPGLILSLWGRDSQYDHKGGQQRPMFGAVGVGGPTYLAAVRAIYQGFSKRPKHPT